MTPQRFKVVASIVVVVGTATCDVSSAPTATPTTFTLLQANVGTARLDADAYVYKLNDVVAEQQIAASIVALDPDVVALQEVLPDSVCDAIDADGGESDPGRACHVDVRAVVPQQIDRLLPPSTWDVVCDARHGYECVGIRKDRGRVDGGYLSAPPVVVEGERCDDGFTVGRVELRLAGNDDDDDDDDDDAQDVVVRVLNGHPQSTNDRCRAAQVAQLFDLDDDDSVPVDATIVSGDMNLDPFGRALDEDDDSVPVWDEHVGDDDDGRPFVYASGPTERRPPYPTTTALFTAVLDHVAVRAGTGSCTTLGEAPDTALLDGDRTVMDHRALSCVITVAAD